MEIEAQTIEATGVRPKREEMRLPAELNVHIVGLDASGAPFRQRAKTIDISLSGARISGLKIELRVGDLVGLQSSGGKSRFHVIWTAEEPEGSYRLGLQCTEKGGTPWRDWLTVTKRASNDQRYTRYFCKGEASLQSLLLPAPIQGSICNISEGGCYVQCASVMNKGEILSGTFTVCGVQVHAMVEVTRSDPQTGMGLQWCDLGIDGQEKLAAIFDSLTPDSAEKISAWEKALAHMDKLHELMSMLHSRMEHQSAPVQYATLGNLRDAEDDLEKALQSMDR